MEAKKCLALCVATLLLGGCASTRQGIKPPPVDGTAISPLNNIEGTELIAQLADTCIIADKDANISSGAEIAGFAAAILATVGPKIIDAGIDYAGKRLEEAAAAQKTSLSSSTSDFLYSIEPVELPKVGDPTKKVLTQSVLINPKIQCLHLVVFADGKKKESAEAWANVWEQIKTATSKQGGQDLTLIIREGTKAKRYTEDGLPVLVVELRVLFTAEQTAMRLVPTFLFYGAPLARDSSAQQRTLAFVLNFSTTDGKVFAANTLTLPPLKPRIFVGPLVMPRFELPWVQVPAAPTTALERAAQYSAIEPLQFAQPIVQAQFKALRRSLPFNIAATVVETSEGKKWLAEIASAIKSSKTELSSAITEEVLPGAKEAAGKKEVTEELGKAQTLQLALIDEKSACAAWQKAKTANADDAITKWRAVVAARYTANLAAVAAGQAIPFTMPLQENCSQPTS